MTDQPDEPMADDENLELTITFSYEPDGATQSLFGVSEETLLDVAGAVLERVGISESVEISVLVSDDAGIERLNREYRGRDEATDVLSFPLLDAPIVDAPAEELWSAAATDEDTEVDEDDDLDALLAGLAVSDEHDEHDEHDEAIAGAADASEDQSADGANIFVLHSSDLDDDTLDAFSAANGADGGDGEDAESWPLHLGDIALSRDAVIRQAQQAGHSAAWECAYLVAHSVLHLVGYDDQTEAGYRAMIAHQEAALAEVGVPR